MIGGAVIWSVEAYENRLRVHTELGGVRLGMTKDDVLFEKGEPDQKQDWEDGGKRWDYGGTSIFFDNGTVKGILKDQVFATVSGIRVGADSDSVTAKFSEPIIKKDGARRRYEYPRYNVRFVVEKRRVTHIIVTVF